MVTVALQATLPSLRAPLHRALKSRSITFIEVPGDTPQLLQRAAATPSITAVIVATTTLETTTAPTKTRAATPPDTDTLQVTADASETHPEHAATPPDMDTLRAIADAIETHPEPAATPPDTETLRATADATETRPEPAATPPDTDTLRAIADATDARPDLAVVLLGSTEHDVDVLVALASGVAGYLPTTASPSAVADAVVAVLAGAIVAPTNVTGPLVRNLRTGSRRMAVSDRSSRVVALTAREWEVFVLLRQGRTTGEMAHHMVVAPVTVRSHVAALVAKFGVRSRDDLADS